jgi:transposase
MLPKELQTAINHMSPDNRRVAEAIVIFYEDYYGRKPGGQKGHDGTTLKMVDCPDVQVTHRVEGCEVCKKHLGNEVAGQIILLPYKRMEAFVADLFGHKMSSGTFSNFRKEAFEALSGFEDGLKAVLAKAKVVGFDETGLRVDIRGRWEVHARRGREAMDAIGILPKFKGVAVHDFWKAYYHYACDHAVCAAHLLRELTFIKECCKQTWATDFISFFLQMKTARERAIAQGKSSLSKLWGRHPKTMALNLLERFRDYHEDSLRFFHDFDVPFDNNLSERDIRMTKVKQKISGCFKTFDGAKYFARTRSFVSTAQKQHVGILGALKDLFGVNQVELKLVGAAE